jgi:hypothetical protein
MRLFMPALWADAVACRSGTGFVPTSATTALTCTAAAALSAPLATAIPAASHEISVIHTLFLRTYHKIAPAAVSDGEDAASSIFFG